MKNDSRGPRDRGPKSQNPPRPARKTYNIPPAARVDRGQQGDFKKQGDFKRRDDYRPQGDFKKRDDYRPQGDFKRRDDYRPQGDFKKRDDYRPQGDFKKRDDYRPQGDFKRRDDYRPQGDFKRRDDYRPRPEFRQPASPEISVDMPENLLAGRNPIREALKSGAPLEKLLVATGDLSGAARDIVKMAKDANVVVQYVERHRLDQIFPAHQGMLAFRSAREYASLEDILNYALEKGEEPLVVVLDSVTDPHNLGAIIRSAECAGAHGVVIPERRAAGLTPACEKAAAGALDHMRVARVKNLNRAIAELKEAGLWVAAAALEGEDALSADLTGPIALVIGSEGEGISRMTLELCDRHVMLPLFGQIGSLNASVAAGVLLYEIVRGRRAKA